MIKTLPEERSLLAIRSYLMANICMLSNTPTRDNLRISPYSVYVTKMQTIILCGGRGWRLQEETEFKPKAMVEIGGMPILLHIMNIYAHHNFRNFLLCLGYKGQNIRDYFFHLDRYLNDVELDLKSGEYHSIKQRVDLDYTVSFIETGLNTDTAERVLIASQYITDDQFMISYGDDVSNINISNLIAYHNANRDKKGIYATITAAHASSHFGRIWADRKDLIRKFDEKPMTEDYVNGGFMVFERRALQALRVGETLEDGLSRLAQRGKLGQYKHEGFWHAMNTMKDVNYLNQLWSNGKPWTRPHQKKS